MQKIKPSLNAEVLKHDAARSLHGDRMFSAAVCFGVLHVWGLSLIGV